MDDINILMGLQSSYEKAELEQPEPPQLPMPGISFQATDPHRRLPIEAAVVKPYPRWQQNATGSLHPFKLVGTGNPNEVRVVAGTVNGMLPDGFHAGDVPPFTLSTIGEGVVYVQVGIDANDVVDQVTVATAGTVPGDTESTFNNMIGTYTTDDDGNLVFSNTVISSLWFELCGNVQPLFGAA